MNINRLPKAAALLVLFGLFAFTGFQSRAQTTITTSYTNTFDNGGDTNDFAGSGSVASWIYWYNSPGNNMGITNDVDMDAGNNPNSGSLMVVSPLAGYTQNVFFGTFGNQYGYDFSTRANLLLYSNISFDILVASNTPPDNNGNFGTIGVGIINGSYGYQEFGRPTIPGAASNGWVHLSVPIDKTQNNLNNVPGIAFDINSYGGYPLFTMTNWIDNVAANAPPAPPPPPPTLATPTPATNGLHCIATIAGTSGQYNRYHLCTLNDLGYTFVGQNSVTYTWNVDKFPANSGSSWQQHVFIVGGAPGQYDQAADYNLANCIFLTIQEDNSGNAFFNFRYKTNEPGGNGMLFNTALPGATNNPNNWPVQPVCSLTDSNGAAGTWSITFASSTNVTMTGPGGISTNFVFDPASAALFADPVSICVGAQPNNPNNGGQEVVLGSFAATGTATPLNDNFNADTALDTNTWKNLSNDTNGCVLVPPGAAYQLSWTLPDFGFSLLSAPTLSATNTLWTPVTTGTISDSGKRSTFLNVTNLPGTNSGYFSLIKRVLYQLQVLLPGETAAPGTPSGKTGTPDPQSTSGPFQFTVNAVDQNWYPVPGVSDALSITSSDSTFTGPNAPVLTNGTAVFYGQFGQTGNWTITAGDTTATNVLSNTSSSVNVPN
ncbi:MAG TPA: hypothetical protein VFB72_05775 [Verrucomicrobiae bacterium]|nr:hypothetical protein [Verrucomicrobiae bacterium]